MRDEYRHFRNLNADGLWPGFSTNGLQRSEEGELRLFPLPRLVNECAAPPWARGTKLPRGGVAVDADGTIYFSDPHEHAVFSVSGCTRERAAVPCLGGRGHEPTELCAPLGLAVSRERRALFVADSRNHRVQIFDLRTFGLVEEWTHVGTPIAVAFDADHHAYVLDADGHRVEQFTLSGDRIATFSAALAASGRVTRPLAVASDGKAVFVLDGDSGNVVVIGPDGSVLGEVATEMATPTAIAAGPRALYVADGSSGKIAVFRANDDHDYARAGDAAGFSGRVAALALAPNGDLVAAPGDGATPCVLFADGSFRPRGVLASGALSVDANPHFWNHVHADVVLAPGTHVEFFVYAGSAAPPPPPDTGASEPFSPPWRSAGVDVTDFFVGGAESQAIWLGAVFTNDLHATPVLSQLRIDFDEEGYLARLPAIYRDRTSGDFLERYVTLFESFYQELEAGIASLPALVDPAATADENLPWLGTFVALDVSETLSDEERRRAVAEAFPSYARRGTVLGLREALEREAGVRAAIDEPIQTVGFWTMPAPPSSCRPGDAPWTSGGDSVLGFNTVLASAEPQGAVVGTTAILDQSDLLVEDDYGSSSFERVAHRFTVSVYRGEIDCPGKLEAVRAIVEREKPAHTEYGLCIVDPGIRVGYRARLGVDTVLGGGATPSRLGEGELVLDGLPRARLGTETRVGVSIQL